MQHVVKVTIHNCDRRFIVAFKFIYSNRCQLKQQIVVNFNFFKIKHDIAYFLLAGVYLSLIAMFDKHSYFQFSRSLMIQILNIKTLQLKFLIF